MNTLRPPLRYLIAFAGLLAPIGPAAARFLSIDPEPVDSTNAANFNRYWYANNNPYKYTDPDGKDVVFAVDPAAASGMGHTTLYFQDENKGWYSFDQGAAGTPSSGGVSAALGEPATVVIEAINPSAVPTDGVRIKTTSTQDARITSSAQRSAEAHNSGEASYNLLSNSCTDAAVDVVNNSGAGIEIPNASTTVRPTSWIKELKSANEGGGR